MIRTYFYRATAVSLAVAAALATGLPERSSAQVLPAAVVGVLLDRLGDQANQAVINARNAGEAVTMQAGIQAGLAVANARNALEASLDKTADRLDATTAGALNQLAALVNDVQSGAVRTETDATSRAQVIMTQLPWHNGAPQLAAVGPKFVVPAMAAAYPVRVSFRGNFELAGKAGFQPRLVVGGKTVQPSAVNNQALDFTVTAGDLFPAGSVSQTGFNTAPVELQIPWEETSFFFFKRRHQYVFPVLVGALPASPGRITVTHDVSTQKLETRPLSASGHVCSTRECGNNDQLNVPIQLVPTPGWTLVRGSCRYSETAQGEHSHDGPREVGGTTCVANVTTIHKAIGSSGSVDWTLAAQESRLVDQQSEVSEKVEMGWGETRAFTTPGRWTVHVEFFDGRRSDFAANGADVFLNVTGRVGGLSIKTADPATLVWPAVP